MDTAIILEDLGIHAGAFVVCLVSGVFPLVNAEIFLAALVIAVAPSHPELFLIALMGTLGQVVAKSAMYWGARGLWNLPLQKYEEKMARWRGRFTRSEPGLSLFIFVSAFSGLPPFFVVSILAGLFKIPFLRFIAAGMIGRFLRFSIVVWAPALVMDLL